MIDGLQLNNVRWNDHDSYFRIVFDMSTSGGEPVLQVPHAEASMSSDGKTIRVVLGGIRSLGSNPNAEAAEISTGDPFVSSIKRITAMDDQSLTYEIHLQAQSTYALAGLGSPGRIVIDIQKK
ncbi:MAG: AMIN-like domain-containing (lipo)protein [Thermoleophilia bacterium]